jgi:putative ABC transport system permease protein
MRTMVIRLLARFPRRIGVGLLGILLPVGMLASIVFFVDNASRTMSQRAVANVKVDLEAVATSPTVDMAALSRQLTQVRGVVSAERFAAVDVELLVAGAAPTRARLFAVDPTYLAKHPWVHVTSGKLGVGAMVSDPLGASMTASTASVQVALLGGPAVASFPVDGTVDLRDATPFWALPSGDEQGGVVFSPNAVVVDYATFEQMLLPAIRTDFAAGGVTAKPAVSQTSLPPLSIESQMVIDRSILTADPVVAARNATALRRTLERVEPGSITVVDNVGEALGSARADATNAKILFLLIGIPGVLVAAALSLTTSAAVAASQRREQALLRLRGATPRQLRHLASSVAAVVGVVGSAAGLAAGYVAVSATRQGGSWSGTSVTRFAVSSALAVLTGAIVTIIGLRALARATTAPTFLADRRQLDRGWAPTWMRRRIDLVAVVVGGAILAINAATGGFRRTPGGETQTLALGFFVLLGPLALWLGLSMLATRVLYRIGTRVTRPESNGAPRSWARANMRFMARRPARTGATILLGTLAVAFGVSLLTFVHTYDAGRSKDVAVGLGSDLRVVPAQVTPAPIPPLASPDVASSTPIRRVVATLGTDRRNVLAIETSSFASTVSVQPIMQSGVGLPSLAANPNGVLVDWLLARDFAIHVGDTVKLNFKDTAGKSRVVVYTATGIFRAFAPSSPSGELVVNAGSLPALPAPDFYLVRAAPGHRVAEVTTRINAAAGSSGAWRVSTLADAFQREQSTLASLDLRGLARIETGGTALITTIGVAALGAFVILERRREFAVLRAVGATTRQLLTGPGIEGATTVLASMVMGVPIGLATASISTRILTLLFSLPAPSIAVPVGQVVVLLGVTIVGSAVALAVALVALARQRPSAVLREA